MNRFNTMNGVLIMSRYLVAFIVVVGCFCGVGFGEVSSHAFSVADMLAMERVSDPQVSPDGKLIVFGLKTIDLEADKGLTDLWVVGVDGDGLRQFFAATDYSCSLNYFSSSKLKQRVLNSASSCEW